MAWPLRISVCNPSSSDRELALRFSISEKFGYAIQATATRAIAMTATTANWPQKGSFLKSMIAPYPPDGGFAAFAWSWTSGCAVNRQFREKVTPTGIAVIVPRTTLLKYRDPVRLL